MGILNMSNASLLRAWILRDEKDTSAVGKLIYAFYLDIANSIADLHS